MSRRPRLQFPGATYHVMSRGNRKSPIFDDDGDRQRFLNVLDAATRRYGVTILAVCLMTNHYHLLLETPRANLASAMRHLNGVFAQASNRQHGRTGHLFEARFRSILVDRQSYLRRVARYIVLNPVRAGLVAAAKNWSWSTYAATAALTSPPRWLELDWLLFAFDSATLPQAQERYAAYVNSPTAQNARMDLRGVACGTRRFEKAVQSAFREQLPDKLMPLDYRRLARPSLDVLFPYPNHLRSVRNATIALAHETFGYQFAEIARHLALHPSTISAAYRHGTRIR